MIRNTKPLDVAPAFRHDDAAQQKGVGRHDQDSARGRRVPHAAALRRRAARRGLRARACGTDGGRVVAGSGSVATNCANTTIQQNSSRLAIDWNSFSTRPGESVTFNQPGANAIALNRVVGPSPSALFGKLSANGQVFIVNPNGVIFGPGAQVNVGGLLASTLNLSTSDFMSGHYAFAGGGRGDWHEHRHDRDHDDGAAVVNLGTIKSAPGGYVALIGARAINAGTIETPRGGRARRGHARRSQPDRSVGGTRHAPRARRESPTDPGGRRPGVAQRERERCALRERGQQHGHHSGAQCRQLERRDPARR